MKTALLKNVIEIKAPERVLVFPWGSVENRKGPPFIVDERTVAGIKQHMSERTVQLHFDYEHCSQGGKYASRDGIAPAAGWIKSFDFVPGEGIYAITEWTERAAKMIEAKEYRYLSPVVFLTDDETVAIGLKSVALTNVPAMDRCPPLVAKDSLVNEYLPGQLRYWLNLPETATVEELIVEVEKILKELRQLAGVSDTADQAAILKALKDKIGAADPRVVAVCKALSLKADASPEEVATALADATNPAKVVPASALKDANDRIAALEADRLNTRTKEFISEGERKGKIVQANRAMWERVFKSDPEQATKDLAEAPVIAPPNGRVIKPAGQGSEGGGDPILVALSDNVDPDKASHYRRVREYANKHKCSMAEAIEKVPA